MNIRDLKVGDKIKVNRKYLGGLFDGVVEHLFYESDVVGYRDEEGTLYSVGISRVKAVETSPPAQTKVKIVDLPLGARFKFDLAGGVWVLLDKGLRGTCILEDCKTCSTVNVAETAEAFANMDVYTQGQSAKPYIKDLQEALNRQADTARKNFDTQTWARWANANAVNEQKTFEEVPDVSFYKPGTVLNLAPKKTLRPIQSIAYIKSSLDELLKEAESLGVEVKVESTKSYAVYAK